MEDDWEQLADTKAVVVIPPKNPNINKWDGEDEEDDVKDSWEDEEDDVEEKKDEEKVEMVPVNSKPKLTVQQKIAEKERKRMEEAERMQKEKEEEEMTPEQKANEKLRIQKLQEESDLKTALETFGITATCSGIDAMHPTNRDEFIEFADALNKKINNYKQDPEYTNFLEDLVLKLFASLPSSNIRKVKTTLDNLYLEKQKMEKGDKPKKKGGKVKAKLRIEGEKDSTNFDEFPTKYEDYDEYNDFM